jgi:hypothetical protein
MEFGSLEERIPAVQLGESSRSRLAQRSRTILGGVEEDWLSAEFSVGLTRFSVGKVPFCVPAARQPVLTQVGTRQPLSGSAADIASERSEWLLMGKKQTRGAGMGVERISERLRHLGQSMKTLIVGCFTIDFFDPTRGSTSTPT